MDEYTGPAGGSPTVQPQEEHGDSSTTGNRREKGDDDDDDPKQAGHDSDSSSTVDSANEEGNFVKKVVNRIEAAARVAAASTVPLTVLPPARKPRRKWSENSYIDDVNNQNLTKIRALDQDSNQNVSSTMASEQAAQRPSSDEAAPPDSGRSTPSASMPNWEGNPNGARLSRAQSARESFRSPAANEGSYNYDHYHRQHNGRMDSSGSNSKSAVLSRAKSVGMVAETKLRAGRAAVAGLISDIKTKVEVGFERTFSRSSRNNSSVSPMPTSGLAGGELSQNGSKKDGGFTSPPHHLSRGSSISPVSPMFSYTSTGGAEDLLGNLSKKSSTGESTDFSADPEEQSPIEQVALVVPTTDDPSIPVWTFRTAVLGTFSCILITFLNTYFSYRTEPIVITVTTVLIASAPLGQFMASTLPDKFIRIPGTQRGFSLNPGPFNMKEHTLITIFASGGSTRPGGVFLVNIVKVFLNGHIGFLAGFLVILTCETMGYCWSVLLYKFLVEPARFWWPSCLVNVSLVRALNMDEKKKGLSLMTFFLICFSVAFAYYVIPGLLFPSVSSVSVICLIFKHNVLAQQLGSGSRGLGLGAISFDWATISSFQGSPLIVPWVATVNIVVGFVVQAYLFAPLTFWRNWFHAKNFPIFSSDLFTRSGAMYNVTRVMELADSKNGRSSTGELLPPYDEVPHFSAFYSMSMGFTFALFGAVCAQVIFFNGRDLVKTFQAAMTGRAIEAPDVHTRLMAKYPRIPMRWCALLFLATHLAACVNLVVYKDQLEMKWWGIFLGDAFTAIMIVPICLLVATTNQVPNLGLIPQYIMGFIRQGEPVTNVMIRLYSTVTCGRTAMYLANFKFAHYMKVPPRASFHAQLIGTGVSALVAMLVATWLTESIDNICDVAKLPRNTPWTCPADRVFFDQAVTFGIAGPRRTFTNIDAPYQTLNYYFLPGFAVPTILWLLTVAMPRKEWLHLFNGPLIVKGASLMPPSPVVNNAMWIYVALFFGIYVFHYRKAWWQRYNYVLSAALDAGTVVMALLLYYSLDEGKKSLHWWGRKEKGDHCPLASCPTAPGVNRPGCPTF